MKRMGIVLAAAVCLAAAAASLGPIASSRTERRKPINGTWSA